MKARGLAALLAFLSAAACGTVGDLGPGGGTSPIYGSTPVQGGRGGGSGGGETGTGNGTGGGGAANNGMGPLPGDCTALDGGFCLNGGSCCGTLCCLISQVCCGGRCLESSSTNLPPECVGR